MKNLTTNLNSGFITNIQNMNVTVVLKAILLFFILITFENSIAQGTYKTNDIKEMKSFLSTLKANSESDYRKIDQLINGSNSAIYINDNTLKSYGENFTTLYSDIASLNYLKNNSIESKDIEVVQINIKKTADSNRKIDLSLFSNFPNLKYICVFSDINITKENIINMITGNNEKYNLLYKINQAE